MPDYKAMYFHLAGQMSIAVEALEGLSDALKKAQQFTEELFMRAAADDEDDLSNEDDSTAVDAKDFLKEL